MLGTGRQISARRPGRAELITLEWNSIQSTRACREAHLSSGLGDRRVGPTPEEAGGSPTAPRLRPVVSPAIWRRVALSTDGRPDGVVWRAVRRRRAEADTPGRAGSCWRWRQSSGRQRGKVGTSGTVLDVRDNGFRYVLIGV